MRKAILGAACALAACGGGSGGGSKPTPTPSPTTTPSPTSTPTPAPGYSNLVDFSKTISIASPVVEVSHTDVQDNTSPTLSRFEIASSTIMPSPVAALLSWDPATPLVTIIVDNSTTVFSPADLTAIAPDGIHAERTTSSSEWAFSWQIGRDFQNPAPTLYSNVAPVWFTERHGISSARTTTVKHYFLTGDWTLPTDSPTGTLNYAANATFTVAAADGSDALGITSPITLNMGTGELRGSWNYGPRSFAITGTFVPGRTNPIEGTIVSEGQTGSVVGYLFGPQGREIGLLFSIPGDSYSAAGVIVGRRP